MTRLNLPDLFGKHRFDHAVLCTFAFQPRFFEEYCLEQFKSLDNNNVTVIVDRCVYDELLDQRPEDRPRLANLRYYLHPIAATKLFHPKLYLFASRDRGMLVVGSANLTKPGVTSNAELVGVYRFERGRQEEVLGLFQEAWRFLCNLAERYPSDELSDRLEILFEDAPWLAEAEAAAAAPVRLLHNLKEPLWPQIAAGMGTSIDELHVLSRYFDQTPRLLENAARELRPGRTVVWTQNCYTTMTTAWLKSALVKNKNALVRDVNARDGEHPQPLHAKAIALVKDRVVRLAFGSANFTTSGLSSTAENGNIEIMCLLDGVPLKSCNPDQLFDPNGTSLPLDSTDKLETAPREQIVRRQQSPIELETAWLEEGRLRVRVAGLDVTPGTTIVAVLAFSDGGERRVKMNVSSGEGAVELEPSILTLCRDASVVVRIEVSSPVMPASVSNPMLLVNLQEYDPERRQRGGRRVREAQRSAAQFAITLTKLIEAGEVDQLKAFLTHCDIPLIETARLLARPGVREQWTGGDGMRALSTRNLRDYETLHDAAVGFCDRHLVRMRKHCGRASLAGVPNFMHMVLAVAGVLNSQIERLLSGLEALTSPMTPDEWAGHRNRLSQYLRAFEGTVEIVFDQYVPAVEQRFPNVAVIAAFGSDMRVLADFGARLFQSKRRVDERCRAGLKVRTPMQTVSAQTFPHDLISGAKWPSWRTTVGNWITTASRWNGDSRPS